MVTVFPLKGLLAAHAASFMWVAGLCVAVDVHSGVEADPVPAGAILLSLECISADPQELRASWLQLQEEARIAEVDRGKFASVVVHAVRKGATFSVGWGYSPEGSSREAAKRIVIKPSGGCNLMLQCNLDAPLVLIPGTSDELWLVAKKGESSFAPLPKIFPPGEHELELLLGSDEVQGEPTTSVILIPGEQ